MPIPNENLLNKWIGPSKEGRENRVIGPRFLGYVISTQQVKLKSGRLTTHCRILVYSNPWGDHFTPHELNCSVDLLTPTKRRPVVLMPEEWLNGKVK